MASHQKSQMSMALVLALVLAVVVVAMWFQVMSVAEDPFDAVRAAQDPAASESPASTLPTQAAASAEPSPTASDPGTDDAEDGPMPLAVTGELLPTGAAVDADVSAFMGGSHPMTVTMKGMVQRGDCTIVLLDVTPQEEIDPFSLPGVGVVSDGLLYEGGACDAAGISEAGYGPYVSSSFPAGVAIPFYGMAQKDGSQIDGAQAITLRVGNGQFLFFAPTETTLP